MEINYNIPILFTSLKDLELEEMIDIIRVLYPHHIGKLYFDELSSRFNYTDKVFELDYDDLLRESKLTETKLYNKIKEDVALLLNISNEDSLYTALKTNPYSNYALVIEPRIKDQFLFNLEYFNCLISIDGILGNSTLDDYELHYYTDTEEGLGIDIEIDLSFDNVTVKYVKDTKTWVLEECYKNKTKIYNIQILTEASNCFNFQPIE